MRRNFIHRTITCIIALLVTGICGAFVIAEETSKPKEPAKELPSYARPLAVGHKKMTIPQIDLANEKERIIVVDRKKGQYLGHPTTALMGDGKTIFCVYPTGHGTNPLILKKSTDGGKTWSDRLPTPKSWETNLMAPIIFRLIDEKGKARVFIFSGTNDLGPYTALRAAVSEDEGQTWSELKTITNWGGVMAITDIISINGKPGHYIGSFFDNAGEYTKGKNHYPENRKKYPKGDWRIFTDLMKTFTTDGGRTWSQPESIFKSHEAHLIESGFVRSPDGKTLAMLLRETTHTYNSQIIFSNDEGKTWTAPRPLPAALSGDRHVVRYLKDGRIFVTIRDRTPEYIDSPTRGDWIAWVGTWEDLVEGREGQYRIRLADNLNSGDCGYTGSIVLEDGTIVLTTYGYWTKGEEPYIITMRLDIKDMDAKFKALKK